MSQTVRTFALIAIGTGLFACTTKPEGAAGSGSASAAPSQTPGKAAAKLKATVDGKPVVFKSAFVHSRGGSALQVTLSTGNVSCKKLAKGSYSTGVNAINTDFTLANRIGKDGKRSWGLTRLYFSSSTKQGDHGDAEVTGGDPSKPVTIKLRYEIESAVHPKAKVKKKKLVVDGTIVAQPCGVLRRKSDPKPSKHAAFMTIAGNKFEVRGATVKEQSGNYSLELSSDGHDCKSSGQSDIRVSLNLGKKSPEVANVFLRGDLLSTQVGGNAKDKLTAKYAAKLGGAEPVEFELGGKADAVGYSVELSGKVNAESCE